MILKIYHSLINMKIQLWSIGKGHEPYVKSGVEDFTKRTGRYFPVEWVIVPTPKKAATMTSEELKKNEGIAIIEMLRKEDCLVALDEGGKSLSSVSLAGLIQEKANESRRNLVFLIGGAFGLDDMVLKRSELKWSLSSLTFPHQLVRLILAEQIYRACTILRNEKYHHA
jgi:23S rRNA (pseudouridine1915-N3)-methyltransferase